MPGLTMHDIGRAVEKLSGVHYDLNDTLRRLHTWCDAETKAALRKQAWDRVDELIRELEVWRDECRE